MAYIRNGFIYNSTNHNLIGVVDPNDKSETYFALISGSNIVDGDGNVLSVAVGSANALASVTTEVNVASATAPTSGQVLTATSGTDATWQTPSAGAGILSQQIPFSSLSSAVNLANGALVNVSIAGVYDPVTVDTVIPTPTNIPLGVFGWAWQQDSTGGRVITLPNGTTITGGLPDEVQSAYFNNNGISQFKLANG